MVTPYRAEQPLPRPHQPTTDGKAIASFVLGIIACLGCMVLTGLPAIVFGLFARQAIAESRGTRSGDKLAVAGIAMGAVSLVVSVAVVIVLALYASKASNAFESAQVASANATVRALEAAAVTWRADHANACPTPKQMKDDGALASTSNINDPWGTPFEVLCTPTTTAVLSYGPDKLRGTPDDVRYPP
jgi:Domain of unknown function (DUF4190)